MQAAPMISKEQDDSRPRQVLTYQLGGETYGVDILRVQEIRGWAPVTRLPHTPQHLLGVLNLRGSIVPILDLRVRFGLERADFTPLTVIIVLFMKSGSTRREFGLVVDCVSEVVEVEPACLKEAPSVGNKTTEEFIQGLATVSERMLILLDVDKLIHHDLGEIASSEQPGTH